MLSEALRLIRVFNDMKQITLANRLGLSSAYLSEIESGRKTPSLDIVKKYAEEFSIPMSSIMFFAENLDGHSDDGAKTFISSKALWFLRLVEQVTEDSNDDGRLKRQ